MRLVIVMCETQIVEDLYGLEEPWRTRFLMLIAKLATGQQWKDPVPSRNVTEVWLAKDPRLQQQVAQMLEAWAHDRS